MTQSTRQICMMLKSTAPFAGANGHVRPENGWNYDAISLDGGLQILRRVLKFTR